jgi:hypothetical protein
MDSSNRFFDRFRLPEGQLSAIFRQHDYGSCFNACASTSIARCEACMDALLSPPSASTSCSRLNDRASLNGLPKTISVRHDPAAIAATHPRDLKRICSIRPSATLIVMRMMSPHTGCSSRASPSASASSPTLRGFSKCSSTFSE